MHLKTYLICPILYASAKRRLFGAFLRIHLNTRNLRGSSEKSIRTQKINIRGKLLSAVLLHLKSFDMTPCRRVIPTIG